MKYVLAIILFISVTSSAEQQWQLKTILPGTLAPHSFYRDEIGNKLDWALLPCRFSVWTYGQTARVSLEVPNGPIDFYLPQRAYTENFFRKSYLELAKEMAPYVENQPMAEVSTTLRVHKLGDQNAEVDIERKRRQVFDPSVQTPLDLMNYLANHNHGSDVVSDHLILSFAGSTLVKAHYDKEQSLFVDPEFQRFDLDCSFRPSN